MKQQISQTPQISKMPTGWEKSKIVDLFLVETGTTPPTKDKTYWLNGTIDWITPADMNDLGNKLDLPESKRKITEKALKEINLSSMPINSIVISTRAPVGYIGLVKKELTFNQGCKGLIPRNESKTSTIFFAYYLASLKDYLNNISGGSTFKELSKDQLVNLEIIHPSNFYEQTAIAKILSTTDESLEALERERLATERLRRGVMVRLLENQQWKVVKLGEVVEFSKGKKPKVMINEQKEGYLPYLSTDYLRENLETKYVSSSEDVFLAKEGEIILLWDGSNAGEFFEGKEGVLSTTMVKFNLKTDIHQKYLLYFLKSKQNYLQGQTNGTGIPHVDRKVLMDLDITLPPIEEQKHIAEILSTIDKKLELQKARKEKIERVKKGLMDELLTGKKRVNVDNVLEERK